MRRGTFFLILVVLSIFAVGCAGKQMKATPDKPAKSAKAVIEDPVKKYKDDFFLRYGFFVTDREPVSYYQESLGIIGKENEIFRNLKTIEEVDKFIEVFLKVRDPDPNTPENEFKDDKDQKILDIENETFAADLDIPATYFSASGGLKGDLAHVYLFYGAPHYKEKLSQGNSHVDLMVWYYFDFQGRTLFRFLFYNKFGRFGLFKKHMPIFSEEDLISPIMSPLKEISNRGAVTAQELIELYQELSREDPREPFAPNGVFLTALLDFSSYTDVVIEGGGNKRFGALDPPEPAALTAARYRPTILGQPDDLTGREFLNNSYHSFIPAMFRMGLIRETGTYTFYFLVKYGDLDWEIKSEKEAESVLQIRLSFQNKATKEVKEFLSVNKFAPKKEYLEQNKITAREFLERNKNNYLPVVLDQLPNSIPGSSAGNLADMVSSFAPGTYVVNVDFRNTVTKKSAGGWREEIIIK